MSQNCTFVRDRTRNRSGTFQATLTKLLTQRLLDLFEFMRSH
jgi:hypothetical protein